MKLLSAEQSVGQTIKAISSFTDLVILYESGDVSIVVQWEGMTEHHYLDICDIKEHGSWNKDLWMHLSDIEGLGGVVDGELLEIYNRNVKANLLNDKINYIQLALKFKYGKDVWPHQIRDELAEICITDLDEFICHCRDNLLSKDEDIAKTNALYGDGNNNHLKRSKFAP